MKKLLFINGCIRKRGISRTLELCDAYIEKYKSLHPEVQIDEVCLAECGLGCYLEADIERRNALLAKGQRFDKMFDLARQFAEADEIVVGVPYWDMSFPSVLKVYVEHICVEGITFRTTATGLEGMAKFTDMLYLSTAGGYVQSRNCGAEYMKAISEFLGYGSFRFYVAEGLDIAGNDERQIVSEAKEEVLKLVSKSC